MIVQHEAKCSHLTFCVAACAKTSFLPIIDLGYEVHQTISYDLRPPLCPFLHSRPAKCQKLELLHSFCSSSFEQSMKFLCIRHPYIGLGHFSISFTVKSLSLISLTYLSHFVIYTSIPPFFIRLPIYPTTSDRGIYQIQH